MVSHRQSAAPRPHLNRRRLFATLLASGLALVAPAAAIAQAFPVKPVRLIVPFPPGGFAATCRRNRGLV